MEMGAVSLVGVAPTQTVGASASIVFPCSTKIQKNDFFWYRPTRVDNDGNLHAISYGACSTTPAQSHYSADDLEACALVYALKAIEEIAIRKRVTVITDNSHLLHLNMWQCQTTADVSISNAIQSVNSIYLRQSKYVGRCIITCLLRCE